MHQPSTWENGGVAGERYPPLLRRGRNAPVACPCCPGSTSIGDEPTDITVAKRRHSRQQPSTFGGSPTDNPDRHKRSLAHFCVRAVLLRQTLYLLAVFNRPPQCVASMAEPFGHLLLISRWMPQHFGRKGGALVLSSLLSVFF